MTLPGTYVPSVDRILMLSPFTLSVSSNVPMDATMAKVAMNVFMAELKVRAILKHARHTYKNSVQNGVNLFQ